MENVIIKQVSSKENPNLYSQTLNLRNQLLRLPIGLDLFQEDLSKEVNHITLAAITVPVSIVAKSNVNNCTTNPKEIDTDNSEAKEETQQLEQEAQTEKNIEEGKVVGCIILAPIEGDEKTMKIRQMAVSSEVQGQGLGSKLLRSAEEHAKRLGKTRLYLHGRAHAVGFYLKSGYVKLTEKEFLELGIPHHAMEKIIVN